MSQEESLKLNIGGDKQFDFHLVFNNDINLYCFVTLAEEEWVKDVGDKLYNYILLHPINQINSEILTKDNFACTMRIDNFTKCDFGGEANRFRDYLPVLMDCIKNLIGTMPPVFYVSFFSDTTDHFANVLVEKDKGLATFGANLQRRSPVQDIHLS